MSYLNDCLLKNLPSKYILPFLWLHEESKEDLLTEIEAIYQTGIREFCAESRTYEHFMEDRWWDDFRFMLREAEKRGMRVWLLDDKHFPTGYANNSLADKPELRKVHLRMEFRDFEGPVQNAHIQAIPLAEDESFTAITLYKRADVRKDAGSFDWRSDDDDHLVGKGQDLLPLLNDGLISLSLEPGAYRVYYLIRTRRETSGYQGHYIDMLNPSSCEALLQAVYEPMYAHFKDQFGRTFAGFFSDEPSFTNESGHYHATLGRENVLLPWRDDLPTMMASSMKSLGYPTDLSAEDVCALLPALYHPYDGPSVSDTDLSVCSYVRCAYMDVITRLYQQNFTKMLGDWCRSHGVEYIGHIIEDMNTHQRLGFGPGHYFRALDQQDMSGMDIVLQQMIPGMTDRVHSAPVAGSRVDPVFFNYLLAKLPASLSHLKPHMKSRAMCEIFGAFGWAEGVPMMKQLLDHMIANGINHYVPHAFTPIYPDPDCPPHFYARGYNPQFHAFGQLMTYMARSSHLISDGTHHAPAAVLYMAEAEWGGQDHILTQTVGRSLITHQIDYDVLWEDVLPSVTVCDGKILCGPESYDVLLIPKHTWLPASIEKELDRLRQSGALVLDADASIGEKLEREGLGEIKVSPACPKLRYYHYTRPDEDVWFFLSEDTLQETRCRVTMPSAAPYVLYDPWTNSLSRPRQTERDVELYLPAGGAIFLISTNENTDGNADVGSAASSDTIFKVDDLPASDDHDAPMHKASIRDLKISLCKAGPGDPIFTPLLQYTAETACIGTDITSLQGLERFSGTIRYEMKLFANGKEQRIQLGRVGEVATVYLNGKELGTRAAVPYSFDLQDLVQEGENTLCIDVINNLGYANRETFSSYLLMPSSGLLEDIMIS